MSMIELHNVHFSYGPKKILSDVSLSVDKGETLVILGGSGSGKSTILRLLLGLIEPDQGSIWLGGEEINKASAERLVEIRKKIGMVFQEGALFDSLTVGENAGYFLLEHGPSGSHYLHEVEARVQAMLASVGLQKATIDMMPSELSGGMRRRVAVARSLIYEPQVMLYDEPTTGLDPDTCENLCELINQVKEKHHVCSIMVTHNLEDAWSVGDKFLLLRSGFVLWQGSAKELRAFPADFLHRFFKGEDLFSRNQ